MKEQSLAERSGGIVGPAADGGIIGDGDGRDGLGAGVCVDTDGIISTADLAGVAIAREVALVFAQLFVFDRLTTVALAIVAESCHAEVVALAERPALLDSAGAVIPVQL